MKRIEEIKGVAKEVAQFLNLQGTGWVPQPWSGLIAEGVSASSTIVRISPVSGEIKISDLRGTRSLEDLNSEEQEKLLSRILEVRARLEEKERLKKARRRLEDLLRKDEYLLQQVLKFVATFGYELEK